MKKLRLALVGYGLHGPKYPTYLTNTDTSESIADIVALVDPDGQKRNEGLKNLQLASSSCFSDMRELFASNLAIDGVIVATPAYQRQPVLEAIKADKHVFCENVLAYTEENARVISEAARRKEEVVVCINEQWRFLPNIIALKQMMSTQIGQLRCITIGGKGRHAIKEEIPRIGSHLLSITINTFGMTVTNGASMRFKDGADVIAMLNTQNEVPIIGKFLSDKYDVGRCYILLEGDAGCALAIGGLLEALYLRSEPYDSVAHPSTHPQSGWVRYEQELLDLITNTSEARSVAMSDPKMNPTFWLLREWMKAIEGKRMNPSPPEDYINVVQAMQLMMQ